jgi:tetratricopeptide repeat protein 21B
LRDFPHETDEHLVKSARCLREARELQHELRTKYVESDQDLAQLRQQTADLSYELGAHFEQRQPNVEQATQYYMEALQSDEAHEKSLLSLARVCLRKKDFDQCEHYLTVLLKSEPPNEEASMMMAELMMVFAATGGKGQDGGTQEYKDAAFYFQSILDNAPCNWLALSRMVFLLQRAGRLKDFEKCLQAAQKASPQPAEKVAGFRFCRGIYYRWTNRPQEALVDLNFARLRDPDYRCGAIIHMIEVYLNAENGTDIESLDCSTEPAIEHLREVDSLLKELAQKVKNNPDWVLRIKVYECQSLMFTKVKGNIEKAVQMLMVLHERGNKNFVPALLAMAQAFVLQKQITKARNQLKRIADIAKKSYNAEWAPEFERSWLLLADIYIQSAKYDLACSLCHLAKEHNRSCGKAWEQIGLIYEREQSYRDAAVNYEKAWEFCNQSNPAVGYRLAFNYLKAKRYVEAITVCNVVLEKHPDYPKIRKEVLEKAWVNLRS